MGRPILERIYNEKTPARHNLELPRGPDPRSYSAIHSEASRLMRPMLGMED